MASKIFLALLWLLLPQLGFSQSAPEQAKIGVNSILNVASFFSIEDRGFYHFVKFSDDSPYSTLNDFRKAWFNEVETPLSQGATLEKILGADFQSKLLEIGPLFGIYTVDEPKWNFDQRFWQQLGDQAQFDLVEFLKGELPEIKDNDGNAYSLERMIRMYAKANEFLIRDKINLIQDSWPGSDGSFYWLMSLQGHLVDDLRRLAADPFFRILAFGELDFDQKLSASFALLKQQYDKSTDQEEQSLIRGYLEKLEHARLYAQWFPTVYALVALAPDLQRSGGLALDIERYEANSSDGVYYRTLVARAFPEVVATIQGRVLKAKEDYRRAWEAIAAIGEGRKSVTDYYLFMDQGLQETFGRSFNPFDSASALKLIADYNQAIQVVWKEISQDREYGCEMGDRDLQHRVKVPADQLVQGNLIRRQYAPRFPIQLSPTIHTNYEDEVVTPGDILTRPLEVVAGLSGDANITGGVLLLTAPQYQHYADQREALYKGHTSTAGLQALQDMLMVGGALGMVGGAGAVGEGVAEVRALSQLKWLRRGALAELFSFVPKIGVAQARLANLFWFGVAANAIGVGVSSVYDSLVSGHVMLPSMNTLLIGSRDTGMLSLFSFGVLSRIPGMQNPLVAASTLFGTGTALSKMQGGSWAQSLLMGTKLAFLRIVGPRYIAQAGVSFGLGATQNLIEGATVSSQGRVMLNPWDAGVGAMARFSGFDGLSALVLPKNPGQSISQNPDLGSPEPFLGKTPGQIWEAINSPRVSGNGPSTSGGRISGASSRGGQGLAVATKPVVQVAPSLSAQLPSAALPNPLVLAVPPQVAPQEVIVPLDERYTQSLPEEQRRMREAAEERRRLYKLFVDTRPRQADGKFMTYFEFLLAYAQNPTQFEHQFEVPPYAERLGVFASAKTPGGGGEKSSGNPSDSFDPGQTPNGEDLQENFDYKLGEIVALLRAEMAGAALVSYNDLAIDIVPEVFKAALAIESVGGTVVQLLAAAKALDKLRSSAAMLSDQRLEELFAASRNRQVKEWLAARRVTTWPGLGQFLVEASEQEAEAEPVVTTVRTPLVLLQRGFDGDLADALDNFKSGFLKEARDVLVGTRQPNEHTSLSAAELEILYRNSPTHEVIENLFGIKTYAAFEAHVQLTAIRQSKIAAKEVTKFLKKAESHQAGEQLNGHEDEVEGVVSATTAQGAVYAIQDGAEVAKVFMNKAAKRAARLAEEFRLANQQLALYQILQQLGFENLPTNIRLIKLTIADEDHIALAMQYIAGKVLKSITLAQILKDQQPHGGFDLTAVLNPAYLHDVELMLTAMERHPVRIDDLHFIATGERLIIIDPFELLLGSIPAGSPLSESDGKNQLEVMRRYLQALRDRSK